MMNLNPWTDGKYGQKHWKSGKKWDPLHLPKFKRTVGVQPHNKWARRDLENIYPPTPHFIENTGEADCLMSQSSLLTGLEPEDT